MANLNPLNPLKAPLMATAGHQKSKGRGGPQRASAILESVGLQHDMVEARTKRIKLGDHKTKKIKLGDNTASQPFSISHRRQIQSLRCHHSQRQPYGDRW